MKTILESIYKKATAIGSMPQTTSEEAMNIISKHLIHVPHWPQLPRRSEKEGFANQYLNPMLKAGIISKENGKIRFMDEREDWEDLLASYYEKVLNLLESDGDYETFGFPKEAAEGFYEFINNPPLSSETLMVKGQVSGPVSIGLNMTDHQGNPSFYNDQLRDITVKTLALNARWQVKKLEQLDFPVLLFVDDPGIYSFGTSSYVGLNKKDIQKSLMEITGSIKEEGGSAGVHACAGVDWSIPMELEINIVSFDAYEYFTSMVVYPELLSSFLEKGGLLAWGIVPTSLSIEKEDASSLLNSLQEKYNTLASKGVELSRLKNQMLITPSCGTATLSSGQAEKVYRLTQEIETAMGV